MRCELIGEKECLNVSEAPCTMLERLHKAISQLKNEYVSAIGLLSNAKYSAGNQKFNVVEIGIVNSDGCYILCSATDIPLHQKNSVNFVLITALYTKDYEVKVYSDVGVNMCIENGLVKVILSRDGENICCTAYEHAGGFGPICDVIKKYIKNSISIDAVDCLHLGCIYSI